MKTVVYLHGACSTSIAFQYVREKLPEHKAILVEYDYKIKLKDALSSIIRTIASQLENPEDEIDIIAHSLGGILALNVVDSGCFNIGSVVTISTPYGGSMTAWFMSFLHPSTLFFKEISPYSKFLINTRRIAREFPMVELIKTNKFLPIVTHVDTGILHRAENDNVVTVNSQTDIGFPNHHFVNYNHFEVLQSPKIANTISNFLWK